MVKNYYYKSKIADFIHTLSRGDGFGKSARYSQQGDRLYFVDIRFYRLASVLLRLSGTGNHLFFYARIIIYRLDHRSIFDTIDGSQGRLAICIRQNRLQHRLDTADFFGMVRDSPYVYGQMDNRDSVFVVRRYSGNRRDL